MQKKSPYTDILKNSSLKITHKQKQNHVELLFLCEIIKIVLVSQSHKKIKMIFGPSQPHKKIKSKKESVKSHKKIA